MDSYISNVINGVPCGRHSKDVGQSCFQGETSNGQTIIGVCDFRARKYGYTGTIDSRSLAGVSRGR